jgi:hypothetical protein
MKSHSDPNYALHHQAGVTKLPRSMIKRGAITDLRRLGTLARPAPARADARSREPHHVFFLQDS